VAGSNTLVVAFARRFGIALVITTVFMTGAVIVEKYVENQAFNKIEKVDVETAEPATEVANYLLIGSDSRAFVASEDDAATFGSASGEAAGSRSDTLMVIHVDPVKERAVVVSFPRDLWVEIPGVPLDENHCSSIQAGKCMSKINSAFSNGPDVVIQTLQANFGVPINHYVEVDFKTFQGVVDAIGEVPIYFPYPTRDIHTGLFTPAPGCHLLDGKGALAYARARYIEYYSFGEGGWFDADATADLARIKRQQDFMRRLASLAVAKSASNPLIAVEVVDQVVQNLRIDENLEKEDLLSLAQVFGNVDPSDASSVRFVTLPARNGFAGSLSVLYVDDATAAPVLELLQVSAAVAEPTTTTLAPVDPVAAGAGVATTTTTVPPLPIFDQDRFGVPAEVTAPCV